MAEKVSKTMHCKKAVFLNNSKGELNLEELLKKAIKKCPNIENRKESSGLEGRYVKAILTHSAKESNILCATLGNYERGTAICSIVDAIQVEQLAVRHTKMPPVDGFNQEVLEGLCYISVIKNHVIVIAARAFNMREIENHINWLLTTSGVMDQTHGIALSDQIPETTVDAIKKDGVKSIKLGSSIMKTRIESHTEKQSTSVGMSTIRKLFSLEELMKWGINKVTEEDIEFELTMKINRKRTVTTNDFAANLAVNLRHLDKDDVTLETKGKKIQGDELRVQKVLTVNARDGIPSDSDIYAGMRQYLQELMDNKAIEP